MKTSNILWWGYKHANGSIHAKRYFDRRDIEEARESEFCLQVVGPLHVNSREEAIELITKMTD